MPADPLEISEPAARAARDLQVVFGRLYRRFKELADNRHLTPSQASVLSRLGKEGDASASELAAAERVRPQAVTPTLAVLAERGLIERRPDPRDGRRQVVSLTPVGRAHFEDSRRAGDEWLARAVQERLSDAEREVLVTAIDLLERLTRP
ncbi:MarR family winged helix-turn-helix transcriptional regulator [Antribacter sp. KLBMP9083]|uniref:MarR family winged helix-turn-helix transcriptional regulator n=1 Tax=Antribacter soli TaxID=2910976 RepID=A0AA41QHQ4_9MICO|nr:MarR family winged helix-turn-helix transcriptional regulator [Antribacter soli]MCF4123634.1 MarR family winged helix-turn-helix transcriptional regulator [Antribacter soli]